MSLKSFVNNRLEWDAFNEELDARIAVAHRTLEQAGTSIDMYRAQGEIAVLRRLKYMRDEFNSDNKGLY